jgi:very-short-patch-repair endonuclease
MRYQARGAPRNNERELRQRLTDAEQVAWAILRSRQLQRWKFRRQHRIESMILGFYCPRLRIDVELDGEPHFTEDGRRTDSFRDARLGVLGILVLRFENSAIVADPRIAATDILRVCETRALGFGYS